MKRLGFSALIFLAFVAIFLFGEATGSAQADQLNSLGKNEIPFSPALDVRASSGKLTLLRVNDVGTGFGPSSDSLDVEVIIKLDSEPDMAFGFQLRDDSNRPVHQGMLDILRDAFNHDWTVTIDYDIDPAKLNGVIFRVALTK